jgi:hypothetical protein
MNLDFDETIRAAKELPESAKIELAALIWIMMARNKDCHTTIQF